MEGHVGGGGGGGVHQEIFWMKLYGDILEY